MKYRKKPVVIEAFQYDGDLINSNGVPYVPEWMLEAPHYYDGEPPCELYVKTLEGDMHVSVGDYVIRGINGEIYPCKPDIFVKTYEQANSSQDGVINQINIKRSHFMNLPKVEINMLKRANVQIINMLFKLKKKSLSYLRNTLTFDL